MILYLSLGSNLPPRHQHIDAACRLLEERVGAILARSSDFFSPAWGYQSEHEYLNIALRLQTSHTPMEVLDLTQQIERELGRTVKGRYADRTIDIDLIQCFSDEGKEIVMYHPRLTLPHPHAQERDFVRLPLGEVMA